MRPIIARVCECRLIGQQSACSVGRSCRLPTVEILPSGIDSTMIDATGNQEEEVNGDWCEGMRRLL